eukprot:6645901-Pyramimonas_sp.AAC.1
MARNSFFSDLLRIGGSARNDAIWARPKENGPPLQGDSDKTTAIRNKRANIDVSRLPSAMSVEPPAVERTRGGQHLKRDAITMTCLSEMKARRQKCGHWSSCALQRSMQLSNR